MPEKIESPSRENTAFEEAQLMMLSKADIREQCEAGARQAAVSTLDGTFPLLTASTHTGLVDAFEQELSGGLFATAVQHIERLRQALHNTDRETDKIILGVLDPGTGKTNQYSLGTTRSVLKALFESSDVEIRSSKNDKPTKPGEGALYFTFHSAKSVRGKDMPFWDTAAANEEVAKENLFRVIARRLHAELEFNRVDPQQSGLVRGAYAEVLPNTLLVALTNYSQRLLGLLMPFDLEHLANITPETKRYTSDLTAFSESMSVEQRIALINMTVNAGKVKIHSYDVAAIKASITPQWPAVEEKIKTIEASLLASEVAMQSSNPHVSLDW